MDRRDDGIRQSRSRSQRFMAAGRAAALACLLGAAIFAVGCSATFELASMMPASEVTGSIGKDQASPLPDIKAEDWRHAQAAFTVALDPKSDGQAVEWISPVSGLRGTVAPVGAPLPQEADTCRAFLVSILESGKERWVQGTACSLDGADWRLIDARPWRRG